MTSESMRLGEREGESGGDSNSAESCKFPLQSISTQKCKLDVGKYFLARQNVVRAFDQILFWKELGDGMVVGGSRGGWLRQLLIRSLKTFFPNSIRTSYKHLFDLEVRNDVTWASTMESLNVPSSVKLKLNVGSCPSCLKQNFELDSKKLLVKN